VNFIKRLKLYAMFCLDLQVHVKGYVHITIDNSLSVRKGGGCRICYKGLQSLELYLWRPRMRGWELGDEDNGQ